MNGLNLDESLLLKQYRQTKDIEIERLLTQYGTSLADVREMYPQVTKAISQRQLTTTFPTQPMFFTAGEAAEMGLGIGEGWMLKMSPAEGNGGYKSSLVTPEKWEITEDDLYISPVGEQYSRADIEALLSMPTGGLTGELPATESLSMGNLTEEGQRLYEEYQLGGGKLDIRSWLNLMEQGQLETEQIFGKVFPEQDSQEVLDYMRDNPEQFLADIREIGPTEEMVTFLKSLEFEDEEGNARHLTDEEIQEFFGTTAVPQFEPESWAKDYLWDPFIAGAVGFKQGIETFLFTNPPSPPSKEIPFPVATHTTAIPPEFAFEAAQAGYENALQNTIDGYLRRRADQQEFWASHPELTPKPEYLENPFDNPSLLKDPGYIAYSVSNSLAYTLAVMGTIIGVSAVATPVVGIPAGLAVAGMPEAGNMIDELVEMGVPIEEAIQPSKLYGLAVGGIETVSDLPFIGLIFKPIGQAVKPMWNTIFKGVASRLAKGILTGLLIPQIEGVEEAITQVTHNAILKNYDETQSILEGVSHAYIQGVIASLPFGVIGGGASFQTFRANLSEDTGQKYDDFVEEFQKAGLTKQEAQVQAANELAKTPEGEAELSKGIEAAQEEYWAEHGPAPQPVIPEMAENVLQEMKIGEEMAKKVMPVTPEVTNWRLDKARQMIMHHQKRLEVLEATTETRSVNRGEITQLKTEIEQYYQDFPQLRQEFGKAIPKAEALPEITTGQPYTATVYRGYKVKGEAVDEGLFGKGTYYTTNREYAETYDGKEVQTVNLKNPFVIQSQQEYEDFQNETTRAARQKALNEGKTVKEADELAAQAARTWLKARGHDGLVARDIIAPGDEIVVFEPEKSISGAIPSAEAGMPEAGLQPSMLEEVPAKEIRPEARGKLVQSRIDDYLRLREYNKERVTDRISEIKKALETKGRLPKELGLKGNLRIELARLEALREIEAVEVVGELDRLIRQVSDEIGLRSMPGRGEPARKGIKLARHPRKPGLFPEYTTRQLEEQFKVYQQARQRLSPEVPAVSPIKAEDIPTDIPALTNVALTPKQVERTIDLFKEAVAAPNSEAQRAAAIELRKHIFAQRAALAKESAETMIAEGMNPEEAIKAAEQQFMTGKLPDVTTDYFNDLTQEMRNVLFAKVYNYWKDKSWTELISTFEALTNALAGKSIPRVVGTGTKYFPDGGSAWDRLARVFVGDMEVLETLDQGKSLPVIIEGIFLETGRGSVPLDQGTVNWLKELATISEEDRLLLEKPLSEITEAEVRRIAQSWFYQRRQELQTLLKDGVISQEEYKLQLAIAKDRVFPYKPIEPVSAYPGQTFGEPRLGEIYTPPENLPETRTQEEIRLATFELQRKYREATEEGAVVSPPSTWAEYNKAFEEVPLLTFREKGTIIRTLKSIGMTLIDIGNLIRANKASFDFSFWRQARALAAGHPVAFYRANIEAWKALWSQASSEAHWQRITRNPRFELYEEVRAKTGADPLRILEAPKGTAQWRAAEEMGYLTGERPIPRFTARIPWIKVSGRCFVVGCNDLVWSIWNKCYDASMARAERIASGDIKLEEGEAFSIYEEMADYQKYIADAIQRASLGKAAPLAPALSATFFAPRSKLARLLYPRHLISSNPRVRALAWKDFSLFIGAISGMVMLGYWLGLWNVERDPRNAEFMSIRIGNMRIDPWAGNRQFVVLYSRLITGLGISSVTGQEYEVNPIGALTTFFRSSLAPLSSILLDFWTGKNFIGEEVDIANPKQWLERIAPFALQDIWEAFQDDWQNGLIAILPAIVGEGVQTYTGDWRENWAKLGLPKYPENTGYGIYEPVYDLADFWADTASAFRGVDITELTESKGFPEHIRSIAEALQIIETIEMLPNKRLASLNADPEEGTTFIQYYQMWQERQRIVASGDDKALTEFDADERTRNAYLGNMTQAQYSLLMQYHSLPESEKAEFLGNHPEIYINPREDWLRSHPEENALLALWDKAKIYSEDALGKISSLAQSLGIPENAMIARDPDAVTLLRLQNKGLFDLLDIYGGLDDEIKDAEGLTARDRAVQELYEEHPDFRGDIRRIEALSEGTEEEPTPEDIVEAWVDRGIIVDEFGANSAEARLWLLDNREAHQWALDQAMLTDDGTDWNEPILRLIVQYRDDFDLYEAYGDISSDRYIEDDEQRADARDRLLFDAQDNMTSFGKAYYTKAASSQGYSESNWNAFVEYSALPIWGSWRERFLLDNPDFCKEYTDPEIGNHPLVDETKVRPVARDKIYQQFYDEFQAWDETGGMASKAIENMRAALDTIERGGLTFKEARYSVNAYDDGFPENMIDAYVDWYSTARKDYEDDWFLMAHPEFYKKMYDLGVWTEKRDFSKVPTREVYALYQTYQGLPSGNPRYDFRAKYPDLDAWLVLKFGYKPISGRGDKEAEPTPWEQAAQVEQFKELFK